MEYSVEHGLDDRSRVREVVEKAYGSYKDRLADYHPSMTWVDDSKAKIGFRVLGKSIEVFLIVGEKTVEMTGDLPFMFRPFQKKIVSVIGREVEKWIAKAKAGEL
jgi:hypothetical protein